MTIVDFSFTKEPNFLTANLVSKSKQSSIQQKILKCLGAVAITLSALNIIKLLNESYHQEQRDLTQSFCQKVDPSYGTENLTEGLFTSFSENFMTTQAPNCFEDANLSSHQLSEVIARATTAKADEFLNMYEESNLDPNFVQRGEYFPLQNLMYARKSSEAIEAFLKHPKVNPNLGAPLFIAADIAHKDGLISLLKDQRINPNVRGNHFRTPLIIAAYHGYSDFAQELLKNAETDVNIKDAYGNTALHYAAFYGHTKVVNLLLKQPGIELQARNNIWQGSKSPLDYARMQGHKSIEGKILRASRRFY